MQVGLAALPGGLARHVNIGRRRQLLRLKQTGTRGITNRVEERWGVVVTCLFTIRHMYTLGVLIL